MQSQLKNSSELCDEIPHFSRNISVSEGWDRFCRRRSGLGTNRYGGGMGYGGMGGLGGMGMGMGTRLACSAEPSEGRASLLQREGEKHLALSLSS